MKTLLSSLACLTLTAMCFAEPEPLTTPRFVSYQPAKVWTEAFPVGNGRLGALVFGDPVHEVFELNESSIWKPPRDIPINKDGPALVQQMRDLLFAGKHAEAEKLCRERFVAPGGLVAPYQPLATLKVDHVLPEAAIIDYRREIALNKGSVSVSFRVGDYDAYTRTTWADWADLLAFRYTSHNGSPLAFTVSLAREGATIEASGRNLYLEGSTGEKGVRYYLVLEVQSDGKVVAEGNTLKLSDATEATILIASRTDYNPDDPTRPLSHVGRWTCREDFETPVDLEMHQTFFRETFEAAGVNLEAPPPADWTPTFGRPWRSVEEILADAKAQGGMTPELLQLYYAYCRYLVRSSSRYGGLPANLQGLWNPLLDPPWQSDYHLNINLSMFYWPAPQWGLAYHMEPLVSLAEMGFDAAEPIAREWLGVKEGSFLGTCTDIWGFVKPSLYPCWGVSVSGGAWLLQDIMRSLRFSKDPAIEARVLTLLRRQLAFYRAWCVRNPEGKIVSGPVPSPENTYQTPEGVCSIDMGPAHDQELIMATIQALCELSDAPKEIEEAKAFGAELAQPKIGADGALMEWSKPFDEWEPSHRHLSHAWGLFPGSLWTLKNNPEIAEAIRKALDKRVAAGHEAMGWSLGHMACLRARLNDGEAAMATLDKAPAFLLPNLFTSASGNPQVSDMCGVAQALNEMLIREEPGPKGEDPTITLLPALPKRLASKGSFRLLTSSGLWVSATWKDGKVVDWTVEPVDWDKPQNLRVIVNGEEHRFYYSARDIEAPPFNCPIIRKESK